MDHLHSWRRIVNTLYCSDPVCNAKSNLILQDGKLVKCYNCRQSFLFNAENYEGKFGNLQCPECADGVPTITLERQQKILNEIISVDVLKTIEKKADRESRRVGRNGEKFNVEFEELTKSLHKQAQELEANRAELSELRKLVDRKLFRLKEKRAEFAGYIKAQRAAIRSERLELKSQAQRDSESTLQARRIMKTNFDTALARRLFEIEQEQKEWKEKWRPAKIGRPSKQGQMLETIQVDGQEISKGDFDNALDKLLKQNLEIENEA